MNIYKLALKIEAAEKAALKAREEFDAAMSKRPTNGLHLWRDVDDNTFFWMDEKYSVESQVFPTRSAAIKAERDGKLKLKPH